MTKCTKLSSSKSENIFPDVESIFEVQQSFREALDFVVEILSLLLNLLRGVFIPMRSYFVENFQEKKSHFSKIVQIRSEGHFFVGNSWAVKFVRASYEHFSDKGRKFAHLRFDLAIKPSRVKVFENCTNIFPKIKIQTDISKIIWGYLKLTRQRKWYKYK